jgi:hypothetical protein
MNFRRGQVWVNKETGKEITIKCKATGNRHWTVSNGHHIHEGTLLKYYTKKGEL